MRRDEIVALGQLAGGAASGVAGQAQELHAGIAQRVFHSVGPAAAPVRVVHDRIAGGAYAAARLLSGTLIRAAADALGSVLGNHAAPIAETPSGRAVVGAINGLYGDRLRRDGSALQTSMAVCVRGAEVPRDRDSVAAAFAPATPRLAVFVHGLAETEGAWRRHADRHPPYGDALRAELHYTPVYIRYNSGLHISDNGRRLAQVLDELTAGWPVPVTEIALIGHSMGGLVLRGACHYGAAGGWRDHVRHVVMLGAPHRGAPLERVANATCHAASLLPETRALAKAIRIRSAGVKDLGYGYVVDEDWDGHDPDALLNNTATVVPYLPTANHYFVSATISRNANAPLGRLVGDLLVLHASAWSQAGGIEQRRFPLEHYGHLGGAHHFDLLNHPAVYELIRGWLAAACVSGRSAPVRVRAARGARSAAVGTDRPAPTRSRRR